MNFKFQILIQKKLSHKPINWIKRKLNSNKIYCLLQIWLENNLDFWLMELDGIKIVLLLLFLFLFFFYFFFCDLMCLWTTNQMNRNWSIDTKFCKNPKFAQIPKLSRNFSQINFQTKTTLRSDETFVSYYIWNFLNRDCKIGNFELIFFSSRGLVSREIETKQHKYFDL